MYTNPPPKKASQKQSRLLQSINLLITGNNNVTQVEYRAAGNPCPQPTIEELMALRDVLEAQTSMVDAQSKLIKVYQNRIL